MPSFFKEASHVVVEGGLFVINDSESGESGILKRLYDKAAPSAIHTYEHDGFDPPKCQQGTREAIFERLRRWLLGLLDAGEHIMWLYGAAGAGKTAIALEFARRCSSEGLLWADFVFSGSDPSLRASLKFFAATIAYQVAQILPAAQLVLEEVIRTNPGIFEQLLETQLELLVATPLRRYLASDSQLQVRALLVIVDGLDECRDVKAQDRLLVALGSFSDQMNALRIPIRILIASLSEHHLIMRFNSAR